MRVLAVLAVLAAVAGVHGADKTKTLRFRGVPSFVAAKSPFEFKIKGDKGATDAVAVTLDHRYGALNTDQPTTRHLADEGKFSSAAYDMEIDIPGLYKLVGTTDNKVTKKSKWIAVESTDGNTHHLGFHQKKKPKRWMHRGEKMPKFVVRGDPGANAEVTMELWQDGKKVVDLQKSKLVYTRNEQHATHSWAEFGDHVIGAEIPAGWYQVVMRSGDAHTPENKREKDGGKDKKPHAISVHIGVPSILKWEKEIGDEIDAKVVVPDFAVGAPAGDKGRAKIFLLHETKGRKVEKNAQPQLKKQVNFNGASPVAVATFHEVRFPRPGKYRLVIVNKRQETLVKAITIKGTDDNGQPAAAIADAGSDNGSGSNNGNGNQVFIELDAREGEDAAVPVTTNVQQPLVVQGGPTLNNVQVNLESPKVGATGTLRLSFTNTVEIPTNGVIKVTFPEGFTFQLVSATCKELDGSLDATTKGRELFLYRKGALSAFPANDRIEDIAIKGVTNPSKPGPTGAITVQTTEFLGKVLATGVEPSEEIVTDKDDSEAAFAAASAGTASTPDPAFCPHFCSDVCHIPCRKHCPAACPAVDTAPEDFCVEFCTASCSGKCTRFCPRKCPVLRGATQAVTAAASAQSSLLATMMSESVSESDHPTQHQRHHQRHHQNQNQNDQDQDQDQDEDQDQEQEQEESRHQHGRRITPPTQNDDDADASSAKSTAKARCVHHTALGECTEWEAE